MSLARSFPLIKPTSLPILSCSTRAGMSRGSQPRQSNCSHSQLRLLIISAIKDAYEVYTYMVHAHKLHSHKLHSHKLHSHKLYSHKLHAYKLHTDKLHAYKLHNHKLHTHKLHVCKIYINAYKIRRSLSNDFSFSFSVAFKLSLY